MMRILDIFDYDGDVFVSENDDAEIDGVGTYLFSVRFDNKSGATQTFKKDELAGINVLSGKVYIALSTEHDVEEGDESNNLDSHLEYLIKDNGGYEEYVRHDYDGTIVIDMEDEVASFKDYEESAIEAIKGRKEEHEWHQSLKNS